MKSNRLYLIFTSLLFVVIIFQVTRVYAGIATSNGYTGVTYEVNDPSANQSATWGVNSYSISVRTRGWCYIGVSCTDTAEWRCKLNNVKTRFYTGSTGFMNNHLYNGTSLVSAHNYDYDGAGNSVGTFYSAQVGANATSNHFATGSGQYPYCAAGLISY